MLSSAKFIKELPIHFENSCFGWSINDGQEMDDYDQSHVDLDEPVMIGFSTALALAGTRSPVAQGAGSLTTLVMGINKAKQFVSQFGSFFHTSPIRSNMHAFEDADPSENRRIFRGNGRTFAFNRASTTNKYDLFHLFKPTGESNVACN